MDKIRYYEGYKYQLAADYSVQTAVFPGEDVVHDFITLTARGVLTIRAGYAWDGPSGPTVDTRDFMRASLVHDALYQLMRERLLDVGWRKTADQELRRLCREDGMSWLRAWWVYKVVRFGGEASAAWGEAEILEAP